MSYQKLSFKIRGIAPMLQHNGQTSDPLNQFAQAIKKVSGKRSKTEEDYKELAHIEWLSGLYLKGKKPCLPGFILEAAMVEAGRKSKRGKQVLAGLFIEDDAPLIYDGPTDIDKLWADENFRLTASVRVKQNRVMRTRPKFDKWEAQVTISYDPRVLNDSDVREILVTAGESVGLCDWRPRFGRFIVE